MGFTCVGGGDSQVDCSGYRKFIHSVYCVVMLDGFGVDLRLSTSELEHTKKAVQLTLPNTSLKESKPDLRCHL